MTNRREFLQTGASLSALPLAVNGLLSPGAASAAFSPRVEGGSAVLHKAVVDDRYAEGRRVAEAMGAYGVVVRALEDGDVTSFWYEELDLLWRVRPAAIAGTTQFGPMFALEQLGNERGMHVVLRIEHSPREDGGLAHVMTGTPETLAFAEGLQQQGVEWPLLTAAALAHCHADCPTPGRQTIATPGTRPAPARRSASPDSAHERESVIHYYTPYAIQLGRDVPWDGPLFSWVIAPSAR
jgi:hypothetical protein